MALTVQSQFDRYKLFRMLFGVAMAIVLTACGTEAEPAAPMRAPAPTFTPTAQVQPVQVDANAAAATKQAQDAAQGGTQDASQGEPVAVVENPPAQQEAPAATQLPAEEPTATPAPQNAEAVINISLMNVRAGPGLTHNILGGANQGERFPVTGKNQSGDWWEIDFNGQKGWVFGELVTLENVSTVALAQVIPTPPPPPTPVPVPPTNTPAPAAPTAPPAPKYKFNIAVVSKCEPQQGGSWFSGKTYINGQPQSGFEVAFSYAPDGPVVASIVSGPHEGYTNWDAGYYSHIISANEPRAGNWFVWVQENGQRISEIGTFQTTGPGDGCNQAVVDFDSR